jgi:hypothetical protein
MVNLHDLLTSGYTRDVRVDTFTRGKCVEGFTASVDVRNPFRPEMLDGTHKGGLHGEADGPVWDRASIIIIGGIVPEDKVCATLQMSNDDGYTWTALTPPFRLSEDFDRCESLSPPFTLEGFTETTRLSLQLDAPTRLVFLLYDVYAIYYGKDNYWALLASFANYSYV